MKELTVSAIEENVDVVTDFVVEELEKVGCSVRVVTQVSIAIDEIFSNISNYAYNPEVGSATVQVEINDDPLEVVITFYDRGVRFDPFDVIEPDTGASIDDRQMGGLGILLVKKNMDAVHYEYRDGQNILRISKSLE